MGGLHKTRSSDSGYKNGCAMKAEISIATGIVARVNELKQMWWVAVFSMVLIVLSGCDSFGDSISRDVASEGDQQQQNPEPEAEQDPEPEPPPQTVLEALSDKEEISQFWDALVSTGLDSVFEVGGEADRFTVFAPSNAAFSQYREAGEASSTDAEILSRILRYHIIEGAAWDTPDLAEQAGSMIDSVSGDVLVFSQTGEQVHVNATTVPTDGITTGDGVVHIVDKVLLPPQERADTELPSLWELIGQDERLSVLASLAESGELVDWLSGNEGDDPITVFALTGAGYSVALGEALGNFVAQDPPPEEFQRIVLSSVISGESVTSVAMYSLNGSSLEADNGEEITIQIIDGEVLVRGVAVLQKDIYARNGVLHVVGPQ